MPSVTSLLPARYGRIKPLVNSRTAAGYDALAVLAEANDFAVSAWTVGLHNTPLGTAHPGLVVRNRLRRSAMERALPGAT